MKSKLKLTRWILATVFILLTGLAVLFGCTPETVEEKRVVTFMNGGDVFDVQMVDLGEKYEFPAERPTREQPDDEHIYEFVGWTLDPNYYEYRSEILTEPDYVVGDLTIYAAFRTVAIAETPDGGADLEYSVEFRMPRGDDFGSYSGKTLSKQTVKRYGSAALPSAGDMPVIKGYHFTGAWEGGTLTDVRGNRRVTAVYEKNTYTYSWHYLDEQSSREVAFREPIDLGEKPEVESAFVFDGWFMDEARTIPATLTEAPAEDIDLYAKYHVDFSTASVSHEGNMVYGDDMNKLYVSGLSYADGLDYTFVWTVNNERGDLTEISNYPVKNAGIYNVSVHIYADYHNGVLKDEGDARDENSSTAISFTLDKATLSATVTLNTHSVVYGEEPPAASIEYSGFEFGETAEEVGVGEDFLFMQGDVNVTGNLHAGTYSVKTVPHELQNYKFAEIAAPSFTVEKKNLTVTMSVDNYTYGAGFAPEISFSDDFVYGEGEDVLGEHWFVLNGGSPATKRAGSAGSDKYTEGDILHAGDHVVELKGFESGDYQVHLPGEEQFSVAKRKASAALSAVGGVYGVTPQVSFTLNNVLEQDEARFSADYTYKRGGNGYTDEARFIVGSYTVEAAFHEDGSDYEPLPGANATFNITKAELHVGVAVENKYTYGDQIDPAVTFTRSDFRFNENENTKGLLYGSAQFIYRKATAPDEEYRGSFAVDSYTVEATGYNSDNYEIIYTQSSFDITKKDLTLTVRLDNDSILYGSRPQYSRDSGVLNGILYDGFISGESAQSVFAGALPAVHYYKNSADGDEISINEVFHAGSYMATTTAEAHNYDITVVPESFTVTQRTLYVGIKLTAAALEYGKKPHAGIVYEKEGYDGFYGTEQTKYVSSAAIFYDGATDYYQSVLDSSSTKMVAGKYSLSVTGISEDIGLDYAVTYQHVVEHVGFEITPKALTAVIGKDKTDYTYGDKPVLTLSFEGWAYSENESDLFDDAGSHIVINSSAYNAPVILDAGDYTATLAGSLNTNYKIEVTEATFTVNKKALTVKASVEDLIYGNDPVPQISYTGFIDGEDQNNDLQGKLEYSYSGELSSSNHYRAGSHTLTLSGYSSDNYEIKYEGATFNVSPVEITLTTQDGWSVYADDRESAADGYWYAVSGDIIDGELTFSLSVTRDGYEYTHGSDKYYPAGNYKVSVSFNVNGDYAVKHNGVSVADGKVENDFTVAKKNATINLRGESKWANRSSWSFTPTGVVDPKFTFTGVIVLNDPENTSAQSYSETEINKTFKWREEPVIRLADSDTVVTDNFDFVYTLNLTLGESDFSISKPEGESAQFTYDKQPHAFSVTATADGVDDGDITIEYKTEQSAEYAASVPEFTNAGSYTVWFRVSAPNCTDKEDSFIVTGNREKLTIPTAGKNTFTYNTQLQTYTPASYNEETMNISGNTFTDVPAGGSQTATVSIEDKTNYEWTDSTQNDLSFPFTVDKATVEAPEIAHKTYNKDTQTATVAESELYNVTANAGGVAAGEYDVILTLTAPNNYKWSSGAEEAELKLTFIIDKAQLVRPTAGKNTFTYTGAEQTYTPDSYDEETMTISGNTFTNVPENGSQTATVSIADKTNYEWTDGRQDEIAFAITVAKAEYSVTAGDQTYTYNSKEQGAGISVSGVEGEQNFSQPEITYSYGEQSSTFALKFTDADRYTINYSVGETTNYKQRSGSYTIIINKAEPVLRESSASDTYSPDGGLLTEEAVRAAVIKSGVYGDAVVTFEITDGRGQAVEGFAQIVNADTYTVKVSVSGKNYQVVEAKTYTFTIEQKKVTVTVAGAGNFTYDSESHSLVNTITVSDGSSLNDIGTPAFTLNGSSKPREELVATNAGEYKVNISVTTNGNYAITVDGGEFTVTVSKATLTVTLPIELTYTYNGEDHFQPITVTGIQGEDEYTIEYQKAADWGEPWQIITVADTCTVHYRVHANATNYNVPDDGDYTITINPVQLTKPTADATEFVYNTAPQTYEFVGFDNQTMLLSGDGLTQTNAGKYQLTVAIKDKANYVWKEGGTDDVTYDFTIAKKTPKELPEGVSVPTFGEQVNKLGAKLGDLTLPDNFYWETPGSELVLESHGYKAYYNSDSANYNNFDVTVTFTTRREKVTITPTKAALAFDFGKADDNAVYANYGIKGEGNRSLSEQEIALITKTIKGISKYDIGSTYLADITFTASNNYFELTGTTSFANVVVKIKSVDVGGTLYTIEDALNTATSGQTVTVKNNTSFAEKSVAEKAVYIGDNYYTVKEGVTLFLPCDTKNKTIIEETEDYNNLFNGSGLYCTLTINHDLIVYGKLHVNGARKNDGNDTARTDKNKGYSEINITSGITVTLQSGSEFICYGYAYGDGRIVAMSGSNVKEPFAMSGYKGGTISSRQYTKVFPFNQYALANIICHIVLHQGSLYNVQACVSGTVLFSKEYYDRQLQFIGNNADYFVEIFSADSYVEKYVDNNGYIHLETNGSVNFNNLAINAMGTEMSTKGLQVPVPGNFKLKICSGTAIIPEGVGLKLLPGAELTVSEQASLNIIGSLFAYGNNSHIVYTQSLTKWQDGNNGMAYPYTGTTNAAYRTTPKLSYNATTPAKFVVAGKVTVNGTLAADISGAEGGEVIFSGKTSGTITEDFDDYNGNKGTKGGTFTSTITCHFLQGDGTFLKAENGYYSYSDDKWSFDNGGQTYNITYKFVLTDTVSEIEVENPNQGTFTVMDVIELADAQYSGWVFMGWYTQETCTDESRIYQIEGSYQDDITVYGLFKQVNNYIFEYQNTKDKVISSDMVLESDLESFDPSVLHSNVFDSYDNDATQTAYFDGWYLDTDCNIPFSTSKVKEMYSAGVNVRVNVYAKWSNKVTLTLKVSNGTAIINGSEYDGNKTLYYKEGSKIDLTATFEGGKSTFTISPSPAGLIQTDKTMQFNMPANATTITIKGKGQACFAPGTLVTLADGTQKKVEDLVMGVDEILAFDHMTGQWTSTNAFFIMHRENKLFDTVKLYFSDGTMVHVYVGHGFFDMGTNQYEIITPENVINYIGHKFFKVNYGGVKETVELVSYEVSEVYSDSYSLYTGIYVNHVINNMLAVSDSLEGLYNVFELDENMKVDQLKMQADIEKYGLFTYEEWSDYCSIEEFYLCNVQYLKVALGKNLVTMDRIYYYFNEFLAMFH